MLSHQLISLLLELLTYMKGAIQIKFNLTQCGYMPYTITVMACVLPADAALPGQSAAGRSWRCLIGVVEIRTFQVQNDLRDKNKTHQQQQRVIQPLFFTQSHWFLLKTLIFFEKVSVISYSKWGTSL